MIDDDGRGFEPGIRGRRTGIGNLRDRVASLGGSLDYLRPRKGSTVREPCRCKERRPRLDLGRRSRDSVSLGLLHDQRRHHPEHALRPSTWLRMWQWNAQGRGSPRAQQVEPLPRRDHQGVRHVRLPEREPVLATTWKWSRADASDGASSLVRHVDQHPVARVATIGDVAGNDFPLMT